MHRFLAERWIVAVALSLTGTAFSRGAETPTAADLERDVIAYRKAIHSAELSLEHRLTSYPSGKDPVVRNRTTAIYLLETKLRNDVTRISGPDGDSTRATNCRNCEANGFHVFYTDLKEPNFEIMLEMHPVAEVLNQPATFPVFDPRALGMAADSSPNLAKLKSFGEWIGRADRSDPTVTRETYHGQDCIRLEYRFDPDTGTVRQWFNPMYGPSLVRMEKEFSYRDMVYLDSVETEYGLHGESKLWFPSKVTYSRKRDGIVDEDEIVTVTVISLNAEVDPKLFTIAGMNVPAGTYISGHPISEDACLWNGKSIVPYGESVISGQSKKASEKQGAKSYRGFLFLNGLLFLGLACFFLVRFVRSRKKGDL
ncbi:MAG: hypothetical protein JSS49_01390 [Planctomycetes bacterium]|nr:hypothetical protein [Planctomycetota bacterium]